MKMTGERVVPAPADHVWKALTDPEKLKACIPGCSSMAPDGENAYRMEMLAQVGPVSARFAGKTRMADVEVGRGYTLRFEGAGGAAGFVNGEARVTLTPGTNGTTTLTYVAQAQVGGKLAQIGSRLIDGAAQKVTDDFFTRFGELFVAPPPPIAPAPEAVRGRPWLAYAAAIVGLLIVVYFVVRR